MTKQPSDLSSKKNGMLRYAKESEIDRILEFLKIDIPNCIYMYTDIFTYRLNNPNMIVWVQDGEDSIYQIIVMKYHDSFQLYARNDNWDFEAVCSLIDEYQVQMINGPIEIIKKLFNRYKDKYKYSSGTIFRLSSCEKFESDEKPEIADIEDVPEIAELLSQDEYYRDSYTKEELERQLAERITTGMGRSCIIRKNGKIVAHCASFTEADGIAVSAGTIAHKDYRGHKLGLIVENYMNRHMNEEGFQWFGFILEEERVKKFKEMGNEIVARYAKLVKK